MRIQVDAYPIRCGVYCLGVSKQFRPITFTRENQRSGAFKVIVRPDRDYLQTPDGLTGTLKGNDGNRKILCCTPQPLATCV